MKLSTRDPIITQVAKSAKAVEYTDYTSAEG